MRFIVLEKIVTFNTQTIILACTSRKVCGKKCSKTYMEIRGKWNAALSVTIVQTGSTIRS